MDTRRILMAGLLATSVASTAALARSNVEFELNIGPPPPIVEVVPAPRARIRLGAGLLELERRTARLGQGPLAA